MLPLVTGEANHTDCGVGGGGVRDQRKSSRSKRLAGVRGVISSSFCLKTCRVVGYLWKSSSGRRLVEGGGKRAGYRECEHTVQFWVELGKFETLCNTSMCC